MKRFIAFLMTAIVLFSFSACGDKHNHSGEPEIIMCDMWGASCHTAAMTAYLQGNYENITQYATGTKELSSPAPYHFTWEVQKNDKDVIKDYTFVLSTDMVQSEILYTATVKDNYIDLYNLELQKIYFWTVTVNMEDGSSYQSESKDFVTAVEAPRVIKVEGVTNCRDLGGWQISGSLYVKQGMIYRTGRMNDNKKENITITQEGMEVLGLQLGIKTELDLRQDEIRTESALGKSVNYINIPMSGNDVYKNTANLNEQVCQIFTILADKDNYPIQIHCSVGTDRTGYICFLINGLLGVAEEDLYRDYLFSNFGKIDGMRKADEITEAYVALIKSEEGENLTQKINNYLLKIGVSQSEIDSIKAIMIEER